MSIEAFKKQFDLPSGYIHLNNSGRTPIPRCSRDLMKHWRDRFYAEGQHCEVDMWKEAFDARDQLAKLVNCKPMQVAFFQNAASAISQVAFGTEFKEGDEIIVWDQEYPSNFYPWKVVADRTGAKLVIAKSDNWQTPTSRILDCITPRTRAIAVSWVQFQTGAISNLREIADAVKGKNILLLSDVIQGLGIQPLDFEQTGFDFICGGSHKWLLSPLSVGFLIGKKESLAKLKLNTIGAKSFDTLDTNLSLTAPEREGSLRFEPGSLPTLIMIGLAESLRLINTTGVGNIQNEANRLANVLRKNIRSAGLEYVPSENSIVTVAANSTEHLSSLENLLKEKKVSYGKRGPGIRLSVHAFNSEADLDLF